MKSIPRFKPACRIGIAKAPAFRIFQKEGMALVKDVAIGLGFHWERKMDFLIPGAISIEEISADEKQLVAEMDVETYLEGVISSEMNPHAPMEYLKLHAIVSRSWVMRKILGLQGEMPPKPGNDGEICTWEESGSHTGFHICADDHCQRYQGHAHVNSQVIQAVRETAGQVIYALQEGEVADARFSKCCGGHTETFAKVWAPRDFSYLKAKEDIHCRPSFLSEKEKGILHAAVLKDYDRFSDPDEYFSWQRSISREELRRRILDTFGKDIGAVTSLAPLERGASGRISRLRICGEKGSFTVGKELAIRRLLAADCLLSSAFSVTGEDEDTITISGHGWGHGVGMCQIGAAAMAIKGFSHEEILRFYFPGTIIHPNYGLTEE